MTTTEEITPGQLVYQQWWAKSRNYALSWETLNPAGRENWEKIAKAVLGEAPPISPLLARLLEHRLGETQALARLLEHRLGETQALTNQVIGNLETQLTIARGRHSLVVERVLALLDEPSMPNPRRIRAALNPTPADVDRYLTNDDTVITDA